MKSTRRIFFCSILFLIVQNVFSQTILTGTVTGTQDGEPLPGATVFVKNAENRNLDGAMVDYSGKYMLKIPAEDNLTIVFSFVGFATKEYKFTGQKTLNVSLDEGIALTGVEIVGTRIDRNELGQTKREQISASQKIELPNLESAMVTNVTEALQGALANVDILTGADPGTNSSIRIRGTSSLSANADPLFVLDGVPLAVDISDGFSFATATSEDYGQLLNVSPSDIESIEVLKDAAATAVWGSKGANGVLIITTKKGSYGKLRFTFSSKNEFRKEGNSIPMLNANQYISMLQDAIWNSVVDVGQGKSEANEYLNLLYNTREIGFDPTWQYFKEYNQNVNWLDLVTQTGFTTDNTFSISGGGEKATYRLGIGQLKEDGTTIGTAYRRFNTSFNMRYRFSDRLDVDMNYSFVSGTRDGNYESTSKIRSQAFTKMPNMSPYIIDEENKFSKEYFTPYTYFQGSYTNDGIFNPVAMVHESYQQIKSTSSRMIFKLHYNFIPGLDYYGTLQFYNDVNKSKSFLPQSVTGESYIHKNSNISKDDASDNLYFTTENKLIFSKTVNDDHKVLMAGIWRTGSQTKSSYASTTTGNIGVGLNDPAIGGNTQNFSGGSGRSLSRDVFGLINAQYIFLDRYMLNASYSIEANSNLSANSRWGAFPTAGAAWHLGDEAFMENLNFISGLKIRGSWGKSGNSPAGYIGTFEAIANGYGEMNAIRPVKIQLNNLTYETVTQGNIGADISLFNDRLNFTLEFYDKLTTNLLQKKVSLPSSTGYASVAYYNSGKMSNTGWEFYTDVLAIKKKDFRLSFNFNISHNRNEILELPDNKKDENYTFNNGNYAYKFVENNPLGSFYGYQSLGVYQNEQETYARDLNNNLIMDINGNPVVMKNGDVKVYPGDAKYVDQNGDGVINKYDIVYLGNSNPILIGGMGFTATYKGIGLVASFHGRAGQKVVNNVRYTNENMRGKSNQSTAVLRRWRHEGDDTEIPRALYNRAYNNLGSDRFIEDASFLRLKTLTLKYDLPRDLIKNLPIERLQVYVTGYDLMTLTKYQGQDPEINPKYVDDMYLMYIDNASTPKPQRVSVGLNLNF